MFRGQQSGVTWRLAPHTEPGDEVVVLVGSLADSPEGLVLTNSPVTTRTFEPEDREGLEWFLGVRSWTEAVAQMKTMGGSEADLVDWCSSRLLARLPSHLDEREFSKAFKGLALVALTDGSRTGTDGRVHLLVPDGSGTIPVVPALYELLRQSTGQEDVPTLVTQIAGRSGEARTELIAGTITSLRFLLDNHVAALMWAR